MMTITLSQLLKDEYDIESAYQEGPRIYVVREDALVFYVGQSKDIPCRLRQHLGMSNFPTGTSELGRLILRNKPISLNWQVDLMTLADCMPFVKQWSDFVDKVSCHPDIAEVAMILAYKPCLNGSLNSDPTPLPPQYCEDQDAGQGGMDAIRTVMED